MGLKTHPRRINASSTAIPSWLLAASSIFCRALSISKYIIHQCSKPGQGAIRGHTNFALGENLRGCVQRKNRFLEFCQSTVETCQDSWREKLIRIRYGRGKNVCGRTGHSLRYLACLVEILFQLMSPCQGNGEAVVCTEAYELYLGCFVVHPRRSCSMMPLRQYNNKSADGCNGDDRFIIIR